MLVCSLISTFNAFAQNVPNTARGGLGHGYDLTGSFAVSQEIKWPVLNLDRLIADNRVLRDGNLSEGEFITVSGKNIAEYTNDLVNKTKIMASGGVNVLSLSASFSREAGSRSAVKESRGMNMSLPQCPV